VATEITAVVSGRVRMSGEEIGAGEIVRILPGQSTDFTALTEATTVVVKVPSLAGDKYTDEG
jgi:ethanolamine utilization protein EutQ (cupin superfamily)